MRDTARHAQTKNPAAPATRSPDSTEPRAAGPRMAGGRLLLSTTPRGRQVVLATAADLPFIVQLQRYHSNAVGHLPTPALAWYLDAGRVYLTLENDEPAGYILGRDSLRWCRACRPITQAAIDFQAQRQHLGLALVTQAARDAIEAGQVALQAMCRDDLDANHFWKAAGFRLIGTYDPANARQKTVNCWRLPLMNFRPTWFNVMPPVAGWKARRTTTHHRGKP
jgi:hypothetical protein